MNNDNRESLKPNLKEKTKKKEEKITIPPVHIHTKDEIREIRKKLKMTQRTFAEVLGVSRRAVEGWEIGERKPSRATHRLLEIISTDSAMLELYASLKNQTVMDYVKNI